MITNLPTKKRFKRYRSNKHLWHFLPTRWRQKINWHRYGTKLRHCHPIKQCCDPSIRLSVSCPRSLKTVHFTALMYGILIGSRTHWPAWPYGPGNIVSPQSGRHIFMGVNATGTLEGRRSRAEDARIEAP